MQNLLFFFIDMKGEIPLNTQKIIYLCSRILVQ